MSVAQNLSVNLKLDLAFLDACLAVRKSGIYSPISDATATLVSPTASQRLDEGPAQVIRLTDKYENAYSDFYGSRTPCVYKTGDAWPTRTGPEAYGILREARPIYRHPIADIWLDVLKRIAATLDSLKVPWTSINPLAYANAGEANLICGFVISIGVKPKSLIYDDAVTAGTAVHKILVELGYPTIQVAFVESVVHRSGPGTKLPSFNPLLDDLPALRMPFTPTLGIAIAPRRTPHYEGTGGLYFRLSRDSDDVALLTCAHVARPPPVFKNNTSMTWKEDNGKPREEIIALGTGAYENAVNAIMAFIGERMNNIQVWEDALQALPAQVDEESAKITKKRKEYSDLIAKAKETIEEANALHNEVTKNHTTANRRIIGYVLHSEKIEVNVPPQNYTKDWALVQLYREVIDWANFKGNQIYIGGNLTPTDFLNTMYPQPSERKNYKYPPNGLLQARGVVPESEFRNPTNLDVHHARSLLCVKYGRSTGGTFGRVNGLESLTRHYNDEYDSGVHEDSIEIAVLGCYDAQSRKYGKFSDKGDSGAVVLGRDGRIIGIVTGGAGSIEEIDLSYITPYYWLEKMVKEKYPDCFLYDLVED